MLQQRSLIFILDNSGAKKVRTISVKNKPKRGIAFISDQVTTAVQQLTTNNVKLQKGQLCQVLIMTTKKKKNVMMEVLQILIKIQESFLSLMENLQAHVYLGQPLKNSGLKNLIV